MRNIEYCYFHYRWRTTTVDLSHSAHHVTTEFVLPVLEDADSIQITLGQIMRMIVCRQVDTKSAGLLLYGLQIASANLRRTRFEPYHKDVTVDLFRVPERIIGDEAWSPSDFKDANAGVGRAPSPAKQSSTSSVARTPSPAEPSPAEDAHVARTPSSAKQPSPNSLPAKPTSPDQISKQLSPAASDPRPTALVATPQHELEHLDRKQLKELQSALNGAQAGNWRDLKTVFEFAGIFPPKDDTSPTDA